MNFIDDSLGLAREKRIYDSIIAGNFNINLLAETSARITDELFIQYDLTNFIYKPTHYTEQTSSIIDFVSNDNAELLSGKKAVLDQIVCNHCPVLFTLQSTHPK